MILSKVRPSWYLALCMIAWGIVSGATGAVHSFGGLVACRFFLGATEVRWSILPAPSIRMMAKLDAYRPPSLPASHSYSADGIHEKN